MDEDARDLLREVRRLKGWLVAAVLLFSLALGAALWNSHNAAVYERNYAYLKAQYENQKVQLYELDNRVTQAEARLIALENKE